MADSFLLKKHQHALIPIIFFAFFFLILSSLFSTDRTLQLFLSPSLYPNLSSRTNSSSSHPLLSPVLSTDSKASVLVDTPQVPISEGLPSNSKFDGEKAENDNGILHTSEGKPADLEFNGGKEGNITEGEHFDLKFDGRNEGNGAETVTSQKKENLGFVEVDGGIVEEGVKRGKGCNLYMGKWVRDDGYPVYKPGSCPYVDEAFDCQSNGRPDSGYLRWRWKPDDCDLPRFNATDFLVRLRGKRLMLVGDSMNRNQFESMLCLLREGLTDKRRMYEVHGYKITKGRGFYIFKFVDFNCTIEFVRSHFLVKEGPVLMDKETQIQPYQSIKLTRQLENGSGLTFSSSTLPTGGLMERLLEGRINYFKEGDHIYPQFDVVEAYRRAIKTWAEWIDKNMNPSKQLVFYRAYSSAHYRGGDWDSGGTCHGEKEPILKGTFLDNYPIKMKIVDEAIQQMRVPVILLNITRLTNFRKDGHPSIYGKVRESNAKVSGRNQDCSHWCLPGVPDAWNELIYATLVFQQTAQSSMCFDIKIQAPALLVIARDIPYGTFDIT